MYVCIYLFSMAWRRGLESKGDRCVNEIPSSSAGEVGDGMGGCIWE